MSDKKKLDESITTIRNFEHAVKGLSKDMQIYIQDAFNDNSALVEITEIQVILPKTDQEEPFIVLRAR
jgi:hypothetical protein